MLYPDAAIVHKFQVDTVAMVRAPGFFTTMRFTKVDGIAGRHFFLAFLRLCYRTNYAIAAMLR